MPRSQFRRDIAIRQVDGTAEIPDDAVVKVYEGTSHSTLLKDTMYTTRSGGTVRTQPWTPTDGVVEFYTEYPQIATLGVTVSPNPEQFFDIDIGQPFGDENVLTYGARPDGDPSDNFAALTEAFTGTMTSGSWRYIPAGVYPVDDTLALPSDLDGWLIRGPGPGGTNRLPPAVIQATGSVGALDAIVATKEWLTNGVTDDTGQGWCLKDIGIDGGGFTAGSVHTTEIETTAKTVHGLVVHGSGWKLSDVMVVSANGDGILIPGKGMDGSTTIGESHENVIRSCGVRYTGGHNVHAGVGQQDSSIFGWSKFQYAGGHNIYLEDGPGWSIVNNHPSWGAGDIIRIENAGWQARVALNYVGSVGKYMDGTGYAGGPVDEPNTHYGVYAKASPAIVALNQVNDNAQSAQTDAIGGYFIQGAGMYMKGNTFIYNAGDDGTLLNDHTSGDSIVGENIEMTS